MFFGTPAVTVYEGSPKMECAKKTYFDPKYVKLTNVGNPAASILAKLGQLKVVHLCSLGRFLEPGTTLTSLCGSGARKALKIADFRSW